MTTINLCNSLTAMLLTWLLFLAPAPQPGPPVDLNTMADLFLQRNMVREATAFLLDVLQVRRGAGFGWCSSCRCCGGQ